MGMASKSRWVADWLFTHPTHPFHHHTSVPADAFDNSLGIRGIHLTQHGEGSTSGGLWDSKSSVSAGNDILLVGVAHSAGVLIGYSFGGLAYGESSGAGSSTGACGTDVRALAMFPHFVGRFAFHVKNNQLLVVVNHLNEDVTGIINVTGGDGRERERTMYAVPIEKYGHTQLPTVIASIAIFSERRLASVPKYQFATGAEVERSEGERGSVWTDMETIRADLAKVERLVKGKFFSPKVIIDNMELRTGELMKRMTAQTEARFDVMDAVGMRIFRDTAMKSYYSYMASVSGGGSGSGGGPGE